MVDKEAIKKIIKDCANNPNAVIEIKNGNIVLESQGLFSRANNKELASFVTSNRDIIMEAVRESYSEGIDCSFFQSQINKSCKQAGLKKEEIPDFVREYTSSWMANLPDDIKSQKLTDLQLPGTHDSGATVGDIRLDIKPAFAKTWQQKLLYTIINLPIVRDIVKNWTVTQDKSIGEQLQEGVRLFDFRLAKDDKGELRLGHTFLMGKLQTYLDTIKDFSDKHPGEVIVINMKVDSPYSGVVTPEDVKKAYDMLEKTLGQKILQNDRELGSVKELTADGSKIIFYVQLDTSAIENNKLMRRDKSDELWPDRRTPEQVLTRLDEQVHDLSEKKKKQETKEYNYASFNTTPDTKTIVEGVFEGKNLIKRGKNMQKDLQKFLEKQPDISGFILDSPTQKSIQAVVNNNKAHVEKIMAERNRVNEGVQK